ncbi:hypothetical protein [Streptomyces ipomoeae]|nr:hypothetical protein [Streptomyces ipomoeae]
MLGTEFSEAARGLVDVLNWRDSRLAKRLSVALLRKQPHIT